jgi:protein gp37
MALASQHTFQILTKRPERMRAYISEIAAGRERYTTWAARGAALARAVARDRDVPPRWPLPNVWLGTSVEDQATADARIPEVLATPAAVRWISAEPLLGPVNLSRCGQHYTGSGPLYIWKTSLSGNGGWRKQHMEPAPEVNWVVCGGESGPKARPMHPDWARSLRDQCAAAGTAFFFKQWGEWGPDTGPELVDGEVIVEDRIMEGRARCAWWTGAGWTYEQDGYAVDLAAAEGSGEWLYRLGKKRAGRLLDGVTHDGYPPAHGPGQAEVQP